jgi:hypothetical protein
MWAFFDESDIDRLGTMGISRQQGLHDPIETLSALPADPSDRPGEPDRAPQK